MELFTVKQKQVVGKKKKEKGVETPPVALTRLIILWKDLLIIAPRKDEKAATKECFSRPALNLFFE